MGQRRAITGPVAWVVALLTIGVVVVQDATAQETPPKDAQGYINRRIAYFNKRDTDRAMADSRPSTNVATVRRRAVVLPLDVRAGFATPSAIRGALQPRRGRPRRRRLVLDHGS